MNMKKPFQRRLRSLAVALTAGVGLQAAIPPQEASAQESLRHDRLPHDRLDESDWRQALSEDSLVSYQRYLERHPLGRHAAEAFRSVVQEQEEAALDATHPAGEQPGPGAWWRQVWLTLKDRGSLSSLFASPAMAQEAALSTREEQDWNDTLSACTIDDFTRYLERYPEGRYAAVAASCIIDPKICSDACRIQAAKIY